MLWVRDLGQGYSAFVASGHRVFTQTQDVLRQSVVCLDADTGKTIWEYDYDWPYEAAGVYPGPRSTPALDQGRLYFTSPDGLLACLDQQSGSLLWSIELNEVYGIRGCDFGYSCSPTVIDSLVIVPVGAESASMVAFDAATGEQVWKAGSEPASYAPAMPIELNQRKLIVGYLQNALVIHDRITGEVLHTINMSVGYDEHSAWPVWSEPHLWISGPFRGGSQLLEVKDSGTRIDSVWKSELLSNDVCSSVLVNGHLYGFDIHDVQSKTHRPSRGEFRCLDLLTGESRWANGNGQLYRKIEDRPPGEIGQSGIIVVDGKLLILNELGELILLRASPEACEELARCQLLSGELTWTPPCLHHGRVFVRNQTQAVCVYIGRTPLDNSERDTLTVADLPQVPYQNLAATILAVEPEFAFDVPSYVWFRNWFVACTAILIASYPLAWMCGRRTAMPFRSTVRMLTCLVAGAIGTTILGRLTGQFLFTWPLCLYAVFEWTAVPERFATPVDSIAKALWRRIPVLVFLVCCVAYFLICRRLSLVFEWAFLAGFPGAVPFIWVHRKLVARDRAGLLARTLLSVAGLAGFFATTIAFLKSRY